MGLILDSSVIIAAEPRRETVEQWIERLLRAARRIPIGRTTPRANMATSRRRIAANGRVTARQ